jgi:hypothetical protein
MRAAMKTMDELIVDLDVQEGKEQKMKEDLLEKRQVDEQAAGMTTWSNSKYYWRK